MSDLAQLMRHMLCALLALCGLATAAYAEPSTPAPEEPFRLVWSSSVSCGDAQAFSSELKSRSAVLREAERDEHAITFIVETFRDGPGIRGQLTVRKPDGELSVREVPGATCAEVESAMALIAVLMVDPLAAGAGPRHPVRAPVEATPLPETAAVAPSRPWSLRVEHRLIAQSGVAPRVVWGHAGGLVLTREAASWRPSIGLSAHFARGVSSASRGSAELEWSSAQLSLCPVGVSPGPRWDFRACAAIQLGRLRGEGFLTASPSSQTILWSAAGAQLEGRFLLAGPLWLGWEATLVLPFTRERFYFDPGETLHRIPSWAASGGVGLGLRFF